MTSTSSIQTAWNASYSENAAENYQKYFVPVIGHPCALDLVNAAGLRPGERVLDVACGTGTVARLAAERVGSGGRVSALDVNPAMLNVARSLPSAGPIKWYETAAESVPLPDQSFDVVFCGLGLMFFADRSAALREMHRVLKPGGRLYISTPMPNDLFDRFDRAIARHVSEEASAFVHAVFSLNDPRQLETMLSESGFPSASAQEHRLTLTLPPARDFLWQYIYCTPLMGIVPKLEAAQIEALEREMTEGWQPWATDEGTRFESSALITSARRSR